MSIPTYVFDALPPALRYRAVATQYRLWEGELRRIADFVPRGKVALDIGAWWGPWTYWLSRRSSQVHSFEPVPYIAEFLRTVVAPNVTVHNLALSDRDESAVLHMPHGGTGSEGRSTLHEPPFEGATDISVQVTPLDKLEIPGPIGFIKIDVEGHEMQALRGAEATIIEHKPNLLVEIESHSDRQTRVEDVVSLLGSYGYQATFLRRGAWVPFSEFDLERDQRALAGTVRGRSLLANTMLTRGYVNNFLFRQAR